MKECKTDKPWVLIIDDDPNLRKTLADILKLKGFAPISAGNGLDGLAMLSENPVDVVLIDLTLPDITGIELLKKVKISYPSTQAVILTGDTTLDLYNFHTNAGSAAEAFAAALLNSLYLGPTNAMLQGVARPRMRAMSAAATSRSNPRNCRLIGVPISAS